MRASAAIATSGSRSSGDQTRESAGNDQRRGDMSWGPSDVSSSGRGESDLVGGKIWRKVAVSMMQEGGISRVKSILIHKSLYVLSAENPLRAFAIRVCYHKHFDKAILGLIALNCVFLAMDSNAPNFENTDRGRMIAYSEPVFLALFCLEMALKILSCGFTGHANAYLSDNWNRLDFFVVILGVLAAMDLGNFSAIRVVRVLRPLRTLQGFAGMRRLVVTLLRSMPLLFDVLVLVSFLFFIFGLVGVQLYSGAFTSRCATVGNAPTDCSLCGFDDAVDASSGCDGDVCAALLTDVDANGTIWPPRWVPIDPEVTCGGPNSRLWPSVDSYNPAGYKCDTNEGEGFCAEGFDNPNYGITHFDNVLGAWLTIFQCISLEGWTDVMYLAKDSVSSWSWIYFTSMIILGAFFAVNLALAVLFVSFVDGKQQAEEDDEANGIIPGDNSSLLPNEDETEDEYQAKKLKELGARLERVGTFTEHGTPGMTPRAGSISGSQLSLTPRAVTESTEASAESTSPTSPTPSVATPSAIGSLSFGSAKVTPLANVKSQGGDSAPATPNSPSGGRTPWLDEGFTDIADWVKAMGAEVEDIHVNPDGTVTIQRSGLKMRGQRFCRRLATSPTMASLTMFLIIANTALMASEFYGMSSTMKLLYEILNYVITSYFGVEMVIKLIGLTPQGYVRDKFNVFDGIVVIVSIIELLVTGLTGDGGGMLSALRTGRLLRVFKLARSWPQLRNIISTILSTIPSMSSLAGMLVLFIFIFDLLGMQLFGYQFIFCDSYGVGSAEPLCPPGMGDTCPDRSDCYGTCASAMENQWVTFNTETGAAGKCVGYSDDDSGDVSYYARLGVADRPRAHFDNFFWSFVTIFQVLTGEDWNVVMYDAMRTVGDWACLYFIAIVVVGNYVVLNLFLAILLDKFSGLDASGDEETASLTATERHDNLVEQKQLGNTLKQQELRREKAKAKKKKEGLEKDAKDDGDERKQKRAVRKLRIKVFRKQLEWFVTHRRFDTFILLMITASSVSLAMDAPAEVDPNSKLKYWLDLFDLVFVLIFILEAVLKITALGKRYFRAGWNLLDFFIVSVGICSVAIQAIASEENENALIAAKVLRAMRALRPLRIASRSPGMKVVISALFSAVPAIANVGLVCILFYLIFGILGLNLFMGKMYRCVDVNTQVALDPTAWGLVDGEITKKWCLSGPRMLACVDDRKVAVFSGGDFGFNGDSTSSYGWTCGQTTTIGGTSVDGDYSLYGGEWSCSASDDTKAVLNATDTSVSAGSVFSSGVLNDSISDIYTAYTSVVTDGTLTSTCQPTLTYLEWVTPRNYDFDHIGTSMLVLFETATLEMWLEVMYHGVDAVDEGVHPARDANPAACVFFVIFIIVGSFFIMNLFVGVTIDKFNEMKEESAAEYEAELNQIKGEGGFGGANKARLVNNGKKYAEQMAAPVLARTNSYNKQPDTGGGSFSAMGAVFVTEEQRRWQQVEKMLMQCKPRRMLDPPTSGSWRKPFFHLTNNNTFDGFIGVLIVLNVVVMCMSHAGESATWTEGLRYTNAAFSFTFLLEALLKMIGFGLSQYFSDNWNRFDFAVVTSSIAGFVFDAMLENASNITILRVFRVIRVLRLVKRAKGLQTLLQTLLFSLPALFNVASVLFMFFFIYSVMGMNLFGFVREGEVLGRHANFQNFPEAMAALFRSATGERWNGFMHDCMTTTACVEIVVADTNNFYYAGQYVDWDDVGSLKAAGLSAADDEYIDRCTPSVGITVFYFVSFILLCGFVMLNLVIAVILDNFESYSKNFALPVSDEDFGEFTEEWSRIDRRATYYIKVDKVPELLRRIRAPLGLRTLPKQFKKDALRRTLYTCDVEIRDGNRVHFVDVLKHLAARVDGVEDPEVEEKAKLRSKSSGFTESMKDLSSEQFKAQSGSDSKNPKLNSVHPEPSTSNSSNKPQLQPQRTFTKMLSSAATFRWRSDKKNSQDDDEDLDEYEDDSLLEVVPLVCHHFAAIHVQTMWKGKLARRQVELRKLKKKKRSMRRRREEGTNGGNTMMDGPTSPGDSDGDDDDTGGDVTSSSADRTPQMSRSNSKKK